MKRLLQCHTASSGFEPRSQIPKPFFFHDLCSRCLIAVSPVCRHQLHPLCLWGHSGSAHGGSDTISMACETHLIWPSIICLHVSHDSTHSSPGTLTSLFFSELSRHAPAWRASYWHLPQSHSKVYVSFSLIINWSFWLQDGEWIWVLREGRRCWSANRSAGWLLRSSEPQ